MGFTCCLMKFLLRLPQIAAGSRRDVVLPLPSCDPARIKRVEILLCVGVGDLDVRTSSPKVIMNAVTLHNLAVCQAAIALDTRYKNTG